MTGRTHPSRLAPHWTCACALLCLVTSSTAVGAGMRVRIRGKSEVSGDLSRTPRGAELLGRLRDDAANPIPNAPLTAEVSGDRPLLSQCGSAHPDSGPLHLNSDDVGRFCVVVSEGATALTLRYEGGPYFAGSDRTFSIDWSKQSVTLTFDPEPKVLRREETEHPVHVVAARGSGGGTLPGIPIHLAVAPDPPAGNVFATSLSTNGSGRVDFSVPADRLPPGRYKMTASFDGDPSYAHAAVTTRFDVRARVQLSVPSAPSGRTPPLAAGGELAVKASHADPTRTPTGIVEATAMGLVVGTAPLEQGNARVELAFSPLEHLQELRVVLRYVPSDPWFESAGDTAVVVPVRHASGFRNATVIGIGALVFVFLLATRVQPRRHVKRRSPMPTPEAPPLPGVTWQRGASLHGWQGRVVDAHERDPIPGARIEIRSAMGAVLFTQTTDSSGRFELPHGTHPPGSYLALAAPHHSSLTRPLPPPGALAIALVLRRRSVLARLAEWAKKRGAPFHQDPEATPAHVARVAAEKNIAAWANQVEGAAFGPTPVDEETERTLARETPGDGARTQPL